jgi:hypothetical protein
VLVEILGLEEGGGKSCIGGEGWASLNSSCKLFIHQEDQTSKT